MIIFVYVNCLCVKIIPLVLRLIRFFVAYYTTLWFFWSLLISLERAQDFNYCKLQRMFSRNIGEMFRFWWGIDGHYGQVVVYLHSWGGITFPETPMNSQQFLCEQLQLEPNLVIMVTGPLTNLHACHHLIKPTHRIFMMGGAIEVPGNVPIDYQAEFNFATNPNAVRDVSWQFF